LITHIKETDKEINKLEGRDKHKAYLDEYLTLMWNDIDPEVQN